jgi:hypothetical protein
MSPLLPRAATRKRMIDNFILDSVRESREQEAKLCEQNKNEDAENSAR